MTPSASSIKIGSKAPDFTLPDKDGTPVSLQDHLHPNGVVTAFIHGVWCPACMSHVASLRRAYWFISREKVNILVVAQQPPESVDNFEFSQTAPLPFPIVADETGEVFSMYDVSNEHDLHHDRPSFFIDQDGVIQKINKSVDTDALTPFGV